jgi:molybdenum cofactor guanylyltransferase
MGRDKATIEIDGIPLIRRIYNAAAGCQHLDRIAVVTPWAQRYQSILPLTCEFIPEQPPDRGPLLAFLQALTAVTSTWILTLACDLPNLSTPVLQSWIDSLPSIPPQSIAYLPKHSTKGWEPLCGFYRQNCHRSLLEYIDNDGRSFQGWLKQQVVTELVVANPLWLANCNTPEELASIVADRSHSIASSGDIGLK